MKTLKNLEVGDTVLSFDDIEHTILVALKEHETKVYLLSIEDPKVAGNWYTDQDLENLSYTLPDTPWEPERKSEYWFVNHDGESKLSNWLAWSEDLKRLKAGNVYKTKAEAQAAAERVRKAYRGTV